MLKKIVILTIFFYFLTLANTSFFHGFRAFGQWFNPVALSFVLVCLLAPWYYKAKDKWSAEWLGICSGFLAGFFLSMFSDYPFGFEILILVCLSFAIKFIIEKYVWI